MAVLRILVILPTYNEAENIGEIMGAILEAAPQVEILVVDDQSPDGTGKVVQASQRLEPRIHLLSRPLKDGLAQAYVAGFQWGMNQGYDQLIQMDADFSHRPVDVPRLIQAMQTCDLAIGCRYINGGSTRGWSRLRQFISRGGNYYAQWILRLPYHDLTGGFNGWNRKVLEAIDLPTLRSRGYAFQVELKYRAHRAGFTLHEVPIQFDTRKYGESKMSGSIVWEAAFRVLQMKNHP